MRGIASRSAKPRTLGLSSEQVSAEECGFTEGSRVRLAVRVPVALVSLALWAFAASCVSAHADTVPGGDVRVACEGSGRTTIILSPVIGATIVPSDVRSSLKQESRVCAIKPLKSGSSEPVGAAVEAMAQMRADDNRRHALSSFIVVSSEDDAVAKEFKRRFRGDIVGVVDVVDDDKAVDVYVPAYAVAARRNPTSISRAANAVFTWIALEEERREIRAHG